MVTVQPFSSCVVVIVRPLASVADEVARAVLPPPLLRELDDTLTDELDEADEVLAALADDLPLELFDMLLVSRPSLPIRTSSQSSGMLIRSLEGALAARSRALPHKA